MKVRIGASSLRCMECGFPLTGEMDEEARKKGVVKTTVVVCRNGGCVNQNKRFKVPELELEEA